jgi:hypothetical protein
MEVWAELKGHPNGAVLGGGPRDKCGSAGTVGERVRHDSTVDFCLKLVAGRVVAPSRGSREYPTTTRIRCWAFVEVADVDDQRPRRGIVQSVVEQPTVGWAIGWRVAVPQQDAGVGEEQRKVLSFEFSALRAGGYGNEVKAAEGYDRQVVAFARVNGVPESAHFELQSSEGTRGAKEALLHAKNVRAVSCDEPPDRGPMFVVGPDVPGYHPKVAPRVRRPALPQRDRCG